MRPFLSAWAILLFLLGMLLWQCKVGPNYTPPEMALPDSFSYATTSDTGELLQWFDVFQDTVLQNIIRSTLENNLDLMAATARLEEARLQAGIVKTFQYPGFGYDAAAGGGAAGQNAREVAAALDGGLVRTEGFMTWEVDLWGKLRRASQSAQLEYFSVAENRNALQLGLVAEAASQYFLLCDLNNRLRIAESTLLSRQRYTEILTARFDTGYISEVDKLQAIQQEADVAALIPGLRRQIVAVENALHILMGEYPGAVNQGEDLFAQRMPDTVPEGLPSQLLQRRPDVRAAELALAAQFERIGVAVANMYPSFTLTGVLGLASPQLSSFVSGESAYANGFGGLAGPIFQFRRNKMRVEVEKQRTDALAREFEQTMLIALAEVENALNARFNIEEEIVQRQRRVDAAEKALVLSRARYDFGYTSYLEVIIQENNLFDAQLQLSATQRERMDALVRLYRALGGGW